MTQLQAPPDENDQKTLEPMAQLLWLDHGRLVDVRPPSPVPLHRIPPAGWYGDRLRLFDGRDWTDEVRPIHCPSSLMRVAYEEVPPPEPEEVLGDEPQTATPMEVGLLGLPPPLASEPAALTRLVKPNGHRHMDAGLRLSPPPFRMRIRRAPIAIEVKRGLIDGLKTSRFVLLWGIGATALGAAIGISTSH
jgi:hypothetical protein